MESQIKVDETKMQKLRARGVQILLEAFEEGRILEFEGYSWGMDEYGDIGVVLTMQGEKKVVGTRIQVGQLYKWAESLSFEDLFVLNAETQILKGR